MKIEEISAKDFIQKAVSPKKEFSFSGHNYRVEFSEPEEIRMSVYIREMKIFKDRAMISSMTVSDFDYLDYTTRNCRFLVAPSDFGISIFDLEKDRNVNYKTNLLGNQFDNSQRYCVVNGSENYMLVKLDTLEKVLDVFDKNNWRTQARFGPDNTLWTIEEMELDCRIIHLDTDTMRQSFSYIPKPFDFLEIPEQEYDEIIKSERHCVRVNPGGGMWHSGMLNKWICVPTEDRMIYKTLAPTSGIFFSENYKTNSCQAEFNYFEFIL